MVAEGIGDGLQTHLRRFDSAPSLQKTFPYYPTDCKWRKEKFDSNILRDAEIESFISGLSISKKFNKRFNKNLKTNEIFELNRKHDLEAEKFIDEFKLNLAMSLSTIINILDPDVFIFGGGVSNEIDFFMK